MAEASDLRLMASAGRALASMSALYWTTVAPRTRQQVRIWRARAAAIPDPTLRELALGKLHEERFNVQTAPTFATLAPRAYRPRTIVAIVALQVIYDYLDGLGEQSAPDPLRNGHELFRALDDAVSPSRDPHYDYYRYHPQSEDGGYLHSLVTTARQAIAGLPAHMAIAEPVSAAAIRCGEAQTRAHAVPRHGIDQLEQWAVTHAALEAESWSETVASSASAVISMHALIAAAADERTTSGQAFAIGMFHHSTCVMATVLDGLADRVRDEHSGQVRIGYLRYFPEGEPLGRELARIARCAMRRAHSIPNAGHHVMTLAGVIAYYTSAFGASEHSSKAIVAPVKGEMRPLIIPTFAFMRAWRLAKRLHVAPMSRGARRRPTSPAGQAGKAI